jgi:PAS domain S-box-containing protein
VTSVDSNALLSTIQELQGKFTGCEGKASELLQLMLDAACKLTRSDSGFLAFVSYSMRKEPQLQIQAVTERLLCANSSGYPGHLFISDYQEGTLYGSHFLQNLATEVLLTMHPVIYNDPYYWQHLPIFNERQVQNFMALPLIFRGKVIAVIGLANADENYTQQIITDLSPFLSTCSILLNQLCTAAYHHANIISATGVDISGKLEKLEPEGAETLRDEKPNIASDKLLDIIQEITEREGKLRNIINNLSDVIWSSSLDDSILYFVNDACKKLYGYEPSDFYTDRMLWLKVIHPEDAPQVLKNHKVLLAEGHIDHEYRIVMLSGEIKWVINRVWIIRDKQGNPVRMDGITKDASVRRKAVEKLELALVKEHELNLQLLLREEELARQDEALRLANKQLSVSIERLKKNEIALKRAQSLAKIGNFEWDFVRDELVCSEEISCILGIDLTVIPDRKIDYFVKLVHPDDLSRIQAVMLKVLSGKKNGAKLQCRILTNTKEIKHISICVDTIEKSPEGKVYRISGIIQDVTSTLLSVHQLKEEKIRSELALWGGNLGLWDWDINNGCVTYNDRWAEMLGYTLAEINSTVDAWTDLIHPADKEEVFSILNTHLSGKTPFFQSEHRLKCKNGEWLWVQDSGRIIKWDANGKPSRAIGTHKDINAKKLAEEEVRKLALVAQKTENGVVITDSKGFTEWVNEGFTRITGFSLAEVKGKEPGSLLQGAATDSATILMMREKISKGNRYYKT